MVSTSKRRDLTLDRFPRTQQPLFLNFQRSATFTLLHSKIKEIACPFLSLEIAMIEPSAQQSHPEVMRRLEALENKYEKRISSLESRMEGRMFSLEKRISRLDDRLQLFDSRIDNLDGRIITSDRRITRADDRIDKAEVRTSKGLDKSEKRIKQLEDRLNNVGVRCDNNLETNTKFSWDGYKI
jgi:chromosome segregation ATPase